MVDEGGHHLVAVRVLVFAGMDGTVIKCQDLRARQAQQNGGMGGYDELGAVSGAAVYFHQERQLALRREGGLRFIEQVEAVRTEAVLHQLQKALAVGFFMIVLGDSAGAPAVFVFFCRDVIKAFGTQKISPPRSADAARQTNGVTQFRMRIVS